MQLFNQRLRGSDLLFDAALFDTALPVAGPTPGASNLMVSQSNGPQVSQVDHMPRQPSSSDDVTIRVKATDPDGVKRVALQYQVVQPGDYIRLSDVRYSTDWVSVAMYDDGSHGDPRAGDSIFTTVLSAANHQHRQLIRYRIQAEDQLGDVILVPYPDDPQPNFAYFVYDGVPDYQAADQPGVTPRVEYRSEMLTSLPIYHLISRNEDVKKAQYSYIQYTAPAASEYQWTGKFVYDGQVYDHIRYRNRGWWSAYEWGKNKWKFKFNRGHEFQARDDHGREYHTKS